MTQDPERLKAADLLEAHNAWRRGADGDDRMQNVKALGEAIDTAVECLRTAAPEVAPAEPQLPAWWSDFIQRVCEIDGRDSPEGEPEAMVATAKELEHCALNAIEHAPLAHPAPRHELPAPIRNAQDAGSQGQA